MLTSDITVYAKVEGTGFNLSFKVADDSIGMGDVEPKTLGVGNDATWSISEDNNLVINDGDLITTIINNPSAGYKFKE